MVYGLSTGHEIGLAATGAIFITFALLSSFVFPRFNPNFPGKKGLIWYIPLCFVFFIAMLSAVITFGKDQKVAEAAAPGSSAPAGNVAAGKTVFMSAGCAACHTFTPAGSKGTIGPNLDELRTYANKAGQPLEEFTIAAITHPPAKYVPPGFPTNVMPGTFGKSLSQQQLADLVAFLEHVP
jgi:mono/diheme cytochrome c family protein